jgi:hypothetical protein
MTSMLLLLLLNIQRAFLPPAWTVLSLRKFTRIRSAFNEVVVTSKAHLYSQHSRGKVANYFQ